MSHMVRNVQEIWIWQDLTRSGKSCARNMDLCNCASSIQLRFFPDWGGCLNKKRQCRHWYYSGCEGYGGCWSICKIENHWNVCRSGWDFDDGWIKREREAGLAQAEGNTQETKTGLRGIYSIFMSKYATDWSNDLFILKDEESPDIEFQYDDADSMAAEIAEVLWN